MTTLPPSPLVIAGQPGFMQEPQARHASAFTLYWIVILALLPLRDPLRRLGQTVHALDDAVNGRQQE